MCGKPVNLLADYADVISGKTLTPREYVEKQLNMTPEEKKNRVTFFTELFEDHDRKQMEDLVNQA